MNLGTSAGTRRDKARSAKMAPADLGHQQGPKQNLKKLGAIPKEFVKNVLLFASQLVLSLDNQKTAYWGYLAIVVHHLFYFYLK